MVGNIHIMGIVNLTPDSFYAGSRAQGEEAIRRIEILFQEGADVVDLGACSTRPGSRQPSEDEEWGRLRPVLETVGKGVPFSGTFARIGSRSDVEEKGTPFPAVSIDTYRSGIVRRAYELIGPFMVNDISAGGMDSRMLETVGQLGLPYVAMHMKGTPETMQEQTDYKDLIEEINAYFRSFAVKAREAGIGTWLADPGFGFSKTLEQNWELLGRLDELDTPQPLLVGLSRKSMLYKALGITPEEAMPATQIVQFAALEKGATWLRTHDVAEAVRTARLYSTMYTSSPGAAK